MLVDSHAHLSGEAYDSDRDAVVQRAYAAGVTQILNIATSPEELQQGLTLSARYPWISLAGAITPHDAHHESSETFARFAAHAAAGDFVALGETGLDYCHWRHTAEPQKALFRRYIELAQEYDLPLVIHCRDAFADFFEVVDHAPKLRAVLHCFTGTHEEAQGVVERGFYISFSGIVTFPKSGELRETLLQLPLDRVLIETDAPYLAPRAYRGTRNEPAYVRQVAEIVAETLSLPFETVAQQTVENAKTLFRLP